MILKTDTVWGLRRVVFFLLSSTITFLTVKAWLKGFTEHVSVTSSNIVESNMLHSFGHHVVCCWKLLNEV